MKDEEVRLVHVNDAVRDHELDEMQAAVDQAEPGEWRVRAGRVVRYGSQSAAEAPESLHLMAKSRSWVPRLLRGVRALEEALRSAWGSAAASRRELAGERAAREADSLRRAEGKVGPEGEVATLARLCAAGAFQESRIPYLERLLRTWAGGGSVDHDGRLSSELDAALRHQREREAVAREVEADAKALQAKLRDWLRRLDAGEVPEEMKAAWGRTKRRTR